MGRLYSVTFEEVSVGTAAQDLFEINAGAGESLVVHGLVLGQSSDAGDSESEQINILVHRGSTSGSVGSTPTPAPLDPGDAAATFTAEANNTTQGTEGTQIHSDCFNVMAGYQLFLPPELRWVIPISGRLIVEMQSTLADVVTMSGTIYVEEVG